MAIRKAWLVVGILALIAQMVSALIKSGMLAKRSAMAKTIGPFMNVMSLLVFIVAWGLYVGSGPAGPYNNYPR